MTATENPISEMISTIAPADCQRAAAQLAQDIFAGLFRKAFTKDPEELGRTLAELESRGVTWCEAGDSIEGQILRLAMLVNGLDQWGLAYTQTFDLTAIPPLSALIASLRGRLNDEADTLFQQFFEWIEQGETHVVDFKIELRRSIHLALWHAMNACENAEDTQAILQPLGSMLITLDQKMPELGWRFVADALAHIQISLLSDTADAGRDSAQMLFESLRHAMPQERFQNILRLSSQVALAWQQAQRPGAIQ